MVIDLTADIFNGALSPSGDPPVVMSAHNSIDTDGFALSKVVFGTHQGTHIDAPSHMIKNAQSISDIPTERFVVRAVKIDLSHLPPNGEIDVDDLLPLLPQTSQGMGVLIETGWDKHLAKKQYFTDAPRITPALAKRLADKRIGLLGVDMPCPNASDWQTVHKILLGAGVLIVEGLVNLKALGSAPFMFYALPLKLIGLDGSPVRAIAVVD